MGKVMYSVLIPWECFAWPQGTNTHLHILGRI